MCEVIDRPALGIVARLGDLFDARSERFLNMNIFKMQLPSGSITTTDNHTTNVEFINTDSFANKVSRFNLTAGLTLNLLTGLLGDVGGSGHYLKNETVNIRSVRSTLIYSVKTKVDNLEINHKQLEDCISEEALKAASDMVLGAAATHVVVRVDWGAKIVVTAETTADVAGGNSKTSGDIKRGLSKMFQKMDISANAKIDGNSKLDEQLKKYSVQLYGDILPKTGSGHCTNWEQVQELIQNFPTLLKDSNEGRGKPITFGLIPITVLQSRFSLPLSPLKWQPIEADFVNKMVHIFDEVHVLRQRLDDFIKDTKNYDYCLTEANRQEAKMLSVEFSKTEMELRAELKKAMNNVKNGGDDFSIFGEIHLKFSVNDCPIFKQAASLVENKGGDVGLKMSLADTLLKNNIRYLKRGESFETITGNGAYRQYVLLVGQGVRTVQPSEPAFQENLNCFMKIASGCMQCNYDDADKPEFIFVDCNIQDTGFSEKVAIYFYDNGDLKTRDLLQETKDIKITGTFTLEDNGDYEKVLVATAYKWPTRRAILLSWCTVTITENNGEYEIKISTTVGSVGSSFRLNKEFDDKTYDGFEAKAIVVREGNALVLIQTLNDPGTGKDKRRTTIRTFTKTGMKVYTKVNGVYATRTFKREN